MSQYSKNLPLIVLPVWGKVRETVWLPCARLSWGREERIGSASAASRRRASQRVVVRVRVAVIMPSRVH